jgi:hypothetical protein
MTRTKTLEKKIIKVKHKGGKLNMFRLFTYRLNIRKWTSKKYFFSGLKNYFIINLNPSP